MNSKRGLVIPMVLVFVSLMSITVIMLLRTDRQDKPVLFKNLKHLQMKYIAKGAMQHARLKMKLLSTPAYDAAAFAVGKNPYFDHSAGYADFYGDATLTLNRNEHSKRGLVKGEATPIVTNPGPAFLSGSVVSKEPLERIDVEDTDFDGTPNKWSLSDVPSGDVRLEKLFRLNELNDMPAASLTNLHLVRFYEDISTVDPFSAPLPRLFEAIQVGEWINNGSIVNGVTPVSAGFDGIFPHSQQAIQVVSGAVDPVTGMPDMFTASYFVSEMRVLATQGGDLYGQEAISVSVRVDINSQGVTTPSSDAASTVALGFEGVAGTLVTTSVFKVSRTLNQ